MTDLNHLYAREASLHQVDFDASGFQWIDCNDADASVVSLIRRATDPADWVAVIVNWTPLVRDGYRIGVPEAGYYAELLNSDASIYGGSNVGNQGGLETNPIPAHGYCSAFASSFDTGQSSTIMC